MPIPLRYLLQDLEPASGVLVHVLCFSFWMSNAASACSVHYVTSPLRFSLETTLTSYESSCMLSLPPASFERYVRCRSFLVYHLLSSQYYKPCYCLLSSDPAQIVPRGPRCHEICLMKLLVVPKLLNGQGLSTLMLSMLVEKCQSE